MKIFIVIIFIGYSSVFAQESNYQIICEKKVEERKVVIQRSITKSNEFYKNNFGVSLDNSIKIILCANKEECKNRLINDYKVDDVEAENRVNYSYGIICGYDILIILTKIASENELIFVTAHEVSHLFFSKLSDNNINNNMWIAEGAADNIAYKIVENCSGMNSGKYIRYCYEDLARLKIIPDMNSLRSYNDWNHCVGNYSNNELYRIADIAVDGLIVQFGYESFVKYFRLLRTMKMEEAFYQSFGITCSEYEYSVKEMIEAVINK